MKDIEINDFVWHPCNIDIIKHKVISVRQFENFKHYVVKAVHDVGACGRIEVILDEHKGKLRFVELVNEENIEHSSGLQDFVEGNYYSNKKEAELEFYKQQETLARSNMKEKKRWYEDAVERYEQVKSIINTLKQL